jgi:DNA-binding NarL/FixJ family response regulator
MAQHAVVILYKCPLLAEGIAKYLRAQIGVEATLASAHDLEAVRSALTSGPEVVIFEMSDTLREVDLAALGPQAELIDVSTVMARGLVVSTNVTGLERILQAVRRSSVVGCSSTSSPPAEPCPGAKLAAPSR